MDALKKGKVKLKNKFRSNSIISPFILITFFLLFSFSLTECPRDRPIFKNEECQSIYCSPKEYENNICSVSNIYIKSQWLNEIHSFAPDGISHVCASSNEKGELFLISQGFTAGNAADKYIFAFQKDGNGLFYNDTLNYYSFETIFFPDNKYPEIFYSINIDTEQYLISTQVMNEIFLVDYKNKNFTIYTLNTSTYFSDDFFLLKGYTDKDDIVYFSEYIFCKEFGNFQECYLGLRIFKLDKNNITILLEKNDEIQVNTLSKVNCFQNDDLYIQCIYSTKGKGEEGKDKYNRVITLFDHKNLNVIYNEILQEDYNRENTFDSSIQLNGNTFITGFSLPHNRNIIKLLLKTLIIKDNQDIKFVNYLPEIDFININEDNKYSIYTGLSKRNSMIKISEDKFAILLNEFTDSNINTSFNQNLLIIILKIFDNHSKISTRYYKINFSLYNLLIYEDVRGYTLNNYFGVLLEAGYITNSYKSKAIFLTFGYINSTLDEIPIDKNLKQNNTESIIKIGDFIPKIENNLFNYIFIGVQIVKIPERKMCGYFINNKNNEEIKEGNIVSVDTVLRFILIKEKLGDECSIDFAGVVQEPDFDLMNSNAEKVDIYPVNDTELEREFYIPKILKGRVIKYRYDVGCYDSCQGCLKISNNPNDQQCIECKNNYFFQEGTKNCFESLEGYYLNKSTNTFYPCHSSCATCEGPKENKIMNCLSCKEGFKLYESKNCLICPKYINYEQTECIDEIPEGYFLENKSLGTIGKCHELCKTCKGSPKLWSMNCIECKYSDFDFKPNYEGDCPMADDYEDDDEEEIMMPGGECPRNKPILVRNDFCFAGYCLPQEYIEKICLVSNSIIKTQWMNNIQRFGEDFIFISLDYGENGDLFLFAQKRENKLYENAIFGFNKYGGPLFYNPENDDEYYSYKKMQFPKDIYIEKIKFIKNSENNRTFLLSTPVKDEMYEIDYNEGNTYIHNFDDFSYSSDNILSLRNYPGEYISYFIFCQNSYDLKQCYPYFRRFKFESNNIIDIIREVKVDININSDTNFICLENVYNFLECIYSKINKHLLGLFDINTFEELDTFDVDLDFEIEAFFDSMISLNDNAFIIAFSTENNIVRVIIKNILFDFNNAAPMFSNYIEGIDYIDINEDDYFKYNSSLSDRNSLSRINDEKFALLINSFNDLNDGVYENPNIVIYIFNIFNKRQNINMRRYSINFKLYNTFNCGKILGYNLGQFFGIFIELSSTEHKEKANSAFMTFGYVNTTNTSYIFDNNFIVGNNLISKTLLLNDYIGDIENNLFGYISLGVIILSLPDESIGNFIKYSGEKILINETLTINTEIKLKLKDNYTAGNYSIIFAGTVQEPHFDNLNKYADKIYSYPEDSKVDERDFYEPQILIGGKIEYKFELKEKTEEECYPSCATCYSYSKDEDNHQCKICKPGYYFKEDTYNCYKEINEYYYFDEEAEIFSPCYVDCLTCNTKEINSTYMNCLSCENDYNYYQKTKNCLKCPKYVNYLQTECIDTIPEGYYLSNEKLHTIEKCHHLCKTCLNGPFELNDRLHMNCETCLYKNSNFNPPSKGDCPSYNEEESPIDGQCSRENPILKNNKCLNAYCTKEEYDSGICKISNDYIKAQWLNNFHLFEDLSNYIAYDINEKGDLFLLAQKKDNLNIIQYMYGFNSNGNGIFYDKKSNKFNSFITISKQFSTFIEKIKYIEINNEGYFINILKDKQIYLIDFNNKEIYTHNFYYIPFSFDTIIKLKNRENVYFFDFVFCLDDLSLDNCYIGFVNYKIDKKNDFILDKTNSDELVKVNYNTKLSCFENGFNLIQCKYSINKDEENYIYQQILSLFDRDNFELKENFVLDEIHIQYQIFDSMIQLKDNIFVIAYSTKPNIIKVLFKKLILDQNNNYKLEDHVYNISHIYLNEDLSYDLTNGNSERNNLFKINEDEFVMMFNNCKNNNLEYSNFNTGIVIMTFHIYNMNRNIIIRHYKIDLNLYNIYLSGDIMGYKLGEFIGILIEGTSPTEKYNSRAAFLTFGYVNSTEDISYDEGTNNLIKNQKSIKINEYITGIENNLFGYEFLGVKILSLPDNNKAGYFININNNNRMINLNDILDINSELKFVMYSNPISGNYTISFAGVVREPEYKIANNFSDKVEVYPSGALSEKYFDEIKTLIGKEFKYNFSLSGKSEEKKCYKNCQTCIRPSEDINEQDCITCKEGFYFKDGTRNCYDEIAYQYYFDEGTKKFYPCYRDCYTCKTKEINSTYMNCLTCHNLYKFYQKTKNCLKCPKYVNYLQTGCVDEIPEGYYLSDEIFGIIEKCYHLCKTCKSGPETINGIVHMNCETCLYQSNFKMLIDGNCPSEESKSPDSNKDKNEKKNKSNNSFGIVISIIIVILVLVISGVIIYIKCFKNKGVIIKRKTDYYNIGEKLNVGGKIIPFEDENY